MQQSYCFWLHRRPFKNGCWIYRFILLRVNCIPNTVEYQHPFLSSLDEFGDSREVEFRGVLHVLEHHELKLGRRVLHDHGFGSHALVDGIGALTVLERPYADLAVLTINVRCENCQTPERLNPV